MNLSFRIYSGADGPFFISTNNFGVFTPITRDEQLFSHRSIFPPKIQSYKEAFLSDLAKNYGRESALSMLQINADRAFAGRSPLTEYCITLRNDGSLVPLAFAGFIPIARHSTENTLSNKTITTLTPKQPIAAAAASDASPTPLRARHLHQRKFSTTSGAASASASPPTSTTSREPDALESSDGTQEFNTKKYRFTLEKITHLSLEFQIEIVVAILTSAHRLSSRNIEFYFASRNETELALIRSFPFLTLAEAQNEEPNTEWYQFNRALATPASCLLDYWPQIKSSI